MDASPVPSSDQIALPQKSIAGSRWSFVLVGLLLLVLLFGRSMMRNFDMDEHQFVAPGVFLADHGLLPYRDYPYFHMPHLVYLGGAATAWIPYKLLAGRMISVLCGWGTLLLL